MEERKLKSKKSLSLLISVVMLLSMVFGAVGSAFASPTSPPRISLVGQATVNVPFGHYYSDDGAIASDDTNADITSRIVTSITDSTNATIALLDTNFPGTYTYHYNVEDSSNTAAIEVIRTVKVAGNPVALTAAITAEIGANHTTPAYLLTQANYTSASWTAYTDAISSAITTESDATIQIQATQSAIDAAKDGIATAKAGLVFAGKADLDTAKANVPTTSTDYTAASWADLQTALLMTETTNAEVVDKTTAINDAISGLTPTVQATFTTIGNTGIHTDTVDKLYQEFQLFKADGVTQIRLSSDSVNNITVLKPDQTTETLTPDLDPSLWFNVQNAAGVYTYTVHAKDGITYETTLTWADPTTVNATPLGVTGDHNGVTYAEYKLGNMNLSSFDAMYEFKPGGTIVSLDAVATDSNLWFNVANPVGSYTFLIKQADVWSKAVITVTPAPAPQPDLLANAALTVYAPNVDQQWGTYAPNTVYQANLNFASGTTSSSFASGKIELFNDTDAAPLATNTAKPLTLLAAPGTQGITGFFGTGDPADSSGDLNWNVGEYPASSGAPTKAVFTFTDASGPHRIEATLSTVPKPSAPSVTADNDANTITGINSTMEYSLDNGVTYTKYDAAHAPDLSGTVTVLVRVASVSTFPAGEAATLTFTAAPATPSTWSTTNKTGIHDNKVYQEFKLMDGSTEISLAKTNVKSITVDGTPLQADENSTLWFNVQKTAGNYKYTVTTNAGDVYEATLQWAGPTPETATATGNQGIHGGNGINYAEYALSNLDLQSFNAMYEFKPGGSVVALQPSGDTNPNLWFNVANPVGDYTFLIKQADVWSKAVITVSDLTAYNAALAAKVEADYTAGSWTAYQAVVTANVMTTADSQADVDAATAAITTAQGNLVKIPVVVPGKKDVSLITDSNILLVGDYAFNLSDKETSGYNLDHFVTAAKTAYATAGTDHDINHVYFSLKDSSGNLLWYDLIADPTLEGQPITDLTMINGDGKYIFMNMQ
jgi:hypothetical protein